MDSGCESAQKSVLRFHFEGGYVGLLGKIVQWILEQIAQESLRWLVDGVGPVGEIALFLIVGLSLALGGPLYMSRDNKRRKAAERRPKYGWVEYTIVVIGGIIFTVVGLCLLAKPG
jgi:hypothetical protein